MICEKLPCLSQKMMIYYKMAISGVYENVFQTSKNDWEGAKISFWNCKVWGGGPCMLKINSTVEKKRRKVELDFWNGT